MKTIITCLTKNYFNFSSRASRQEYWTLFLFVTIVNLILNYIELNVFGVKFSEYGILSGLAALFFFFPVLSAGIRRLHDTNRRGWFLFIVLIPIIGFIWHFILLCLKGTPGPNKYGKPPLQTESVTLS